MAVQHYENFPVASVLLPSPLRHPVGLIYRFAREADDFADEGDAPAATRLAQLREFGEELRKIERGDAPGIAWFSDLAGVIRARRLPIGLFHDLLSAFSQDVTVARYPDFAALRDYCRRSADPVGRLLLHLFERATAENLRRSDSICSGLQLTNFWQDVEIDYAKGRIYLPGDEMAREGVSEAHIREHRCDDAWRSLLKFQVERARGMLLEGAPLGRVLPGRIGLEIRATVQGGLRILEKIESARYDVFRKRPVLEWFDWPLIMARAL
jgi:phytoene synthase